jgi:putative endonuclease
MAHTQRIGQWGERVAEGFLLARGLELLERNARTPYGELDLVMRLAGRLVFVEVKTRTNEALGHPETSMTEQKLAHLVDAAEHYLQARPEFGSDWRIDVVAVTGRPAGGEPDITWFEDVVS